MRIHQLTMSAFGPYKGKEVINFDQLNDKQLFLIAGPTGSGKTTIFDAITYVLYGRSSGTGREGDDFISQFKRIEDQTYVEMEFTIRGKRYTIFRSPRQERLKTRGEGTTTRGAEARLVSEEDTITSISEVNQAVETLLGIDVNQFKQIVMLPQGEFRKLLEANSSDKEVIFRHLFKTDQFKAFQEYMNQQLKQIEGTIKEREIELKEAVKSLNPFDDELLMTEMNKENLHYPSIIEEASRVNQQINEKRTSLDETIKQHQKKQEQLIGHLNQTKVLVEKQQQLQQMTEQLQTMKLEEANISNLSKQVQQFTEARFVREAEQHYLKVSDKIEQLQQKQQVEQKALSEAKQKQTTLHEEWRAAYEQYIHLDELKQERQKVTDRLAKYTVWLEKKTLLDELQEKINKEAKTLEQLQQEQSNINIQLANLEKEKQQIEEQLTEEGHLKLQLKESEQQVALFNSGKERLEQIQQLQMKHEQQAVLYKQFYQQYKEANQRFEHHEQIYFRSQAGILAQTLVKDEPCPVCGSLDHPNPAQLTNEILTEEELAYEREKVSQLEKKANEQYSQVLRLNEQIKSQWETLPDMGIIIDNNQPIDLIINQVWEKLKEWNELVKQLNDKLVTIEHLKLQLNNHKVQIEQFENEFNQLDTRLTETKSRYETLEKQSIVEQSQWEQLTIEHDLSLNQEVTLNEQLLALTKQIETIEHNYRTLEELYNQVKQTIVRLESTLKELNQQLITSEQDKKEYAELFEQRLKNAQLESIEQYRSILLLEDSIEQIKGEVEAFYKQKDYYKKQVDVLTNELTDVVIDDLDALEAQRQHLSETLETLTEQSKELYAHYQQNKTALTKIESIYSQLSKHIDEYKDIAYLTNMTTGRNNFKLSFERYVLTAYFDEIVRAANLRLKEMTLGRYLLLRDDNHQTGRGQRGLELLVFDHYTNQKRDVKTLSGGESFMASLALALGLADVVASYAGGIELDTIFIDEGFGTLDPVALDHAIEMLNNLKNHGRVVGIISHVQELKDRMEGRIEVIKTNEGSTVQVIV